MDPTRYARSFDLLDLLIGHPEGLRLSDIASRLELPVSSLHNLLQTMVLSGVVAADGGPRYFVGPRITRLGLRVADSSQVKLIARRHMRDLASNIGDDVYLALRAGSEILCADRAAGTQPISVNMTLGHSWPLHATSAGKLFAACDDEFGAFVLKQPRRKFTERTITDAKELAREFERIRKADFAVSREETIEDVVGYAAPVRDGSGALVAAIHVAVFKGRAKGAHEQKIRKQAIACANAVGIALGAPLPRRGDLDRPGKRNGALQRPVAS